MALFNVVFSMCGLAVLACVCPCFAMINSSCVVQTELVPYLVNATKFSSLEYNSAQRATRVAVTTTPSAYTTSQTPHINISPPRLYPYGLDVQDDILYEDPENSESSVQLPPPTIHADALSGHDPELRQSLFRISEPVLPQYINPAMLDQNVSTNLEDGWWANGSRAAESSASTDTTKLQIEQDLELFLGDKVELEEWGGEQSRSAAANSSWQRCSPEPQNNTGSWLRPCPFEPDEEESSGWGSNWLKFGISALTVAGLYLSADVEDGPRRKRQRRSYQQVQIKESKSEFLDSSPIPEAGREYWKYDELGEAYYHEDSDTGSIFWYEDSSSEEDPSEWNSAPQNTKLSEDLEGNSSVQVEGGLAHQNETPQCISAQLNLLDSNWTETDTLFPTEEHASEDLLMTSDGPSNWEEIWNYAAIEQTFAPTTTIDGFNKETGPSALKSLIPEPVNTPTSSEQDRCQGLQICEASQIKCPWQNCSRAKEFRLLSDLRKHIRDVHEKPVKCNEGGCNFSSGQTKDLRRHQKSVHKALYGEESYRCTAPNCYEKFGRRDNLLRHLRNVHKNFKLDDGLVGNDEF